MRVPVTQNREECLHCSLAVRIIQDDLCVKCGKETTAMVAMKMNETDTPFYYISQFVHTKTGDSLETLHIKNY